MLNPILLNVSYASHSKEKKRSKIVTLNRHTNMTQRNIGRVCEVSLGAVNKNIKQFKEAGSVSPQQK